MNIMLQKKDMNLDTNYFANIHQKMKEHNDINNADKIIDLYEKVQHNQFYICFAGHFSAGKSSIINYILQKEVLPKSPIPTSANIVNISSGEGNARVYFNSKSPVQYNEPYDIDIIKDYCMDKDTIKQIHISTSEPILPQNCILMDTPGIDAADDADRLMTESAVHMIDVLFYVMDYNHVQSEVNLYFLQEMKKRNLPIYIVINQVDKHNEAELSFDDYDKQVRETFHAWGINPEAIFYSSVIQENNEHNQLPEIKQSLFHMMEAPHHDPTRVLQALEKIVDDHQICIREQLEENMNVISLDTVAKAEMDQITNQINVMKDKKEQMQHQYMTEVQTTLKNAYIMPAKLRDIAEDFLKSQEKGFKVGIFQSKKKTEEIKEQRLHTFLQALTESIESTIQWKLREKTIELLQSYHITSESLLQHAQQLHISLQKEDIFSLLKSGAMVNGNYLLNYTNELSNTIKNKYRKQMNVLWEQIAKETEPVWNAELRKLNQQLKPYLEQQENLHENSEIEETIQEKQQAIQTIFESSCYTEANDTEFTEDVSKRHQVTIEKVPEKIKTDSIQESVVESDSSLARTSIYDSKSIINSVGNIIEEITNLQGFSTIIDDLKSKQTKLSNRDLTIALFGTFSAGKSSFSNALFGERVLPVSPNPTTAVISRISPVTNENPHGKVVISLKSTAELIQDLKVITKHLNITANSFDDWMSIIQKERIFEHTHLTKTYQSYLIALISGYKEQRDSLGKQVEISLNEFAAFVTDEKKACYIQAVDLYYDCDLTRKGITLVDTPGADSVNARHTNVAFNYIKEADAILYVTYYNHAITSGDRDFLMQLGRVKDSFEMDKMFFIVNASDLAQSKNDLDLVLSYVTNQLLQFGIRNPKIFPVSSKLSLEEKSARKPLNLEMENFEAAFYSFIEKDLIALTVDSAIWDMERAVNTLQQFIQHSKMGETEKEQKIIQLLDESKSCTDHIQKFETETFHHRLHDRMDRQLHFVLERLYIRFHDLFSEHFNSSTIQGTGKKATQQLEYNRNQFVDYVGYELLQEVRAVSLRIESYMKELLKEAFTLIQTDAKNMNEHFVFSYMEDIAINTPKYVQAFEHLDMAIFQKALKVFKNPKSFFENNDREKMEKQFYQIMKPYAEDYINAANQIMKNAYDMEWQQHVNVMKQKAKDDIQTLVKDHTAIMNTKIDVKKLEEKYSRLKKVVAIYEQ